MSDNLRRYCAIHTALKQLCPKEPKGNHARHLQTLAHLVSGIVGSKRSSLPAIASKVPSNSTRESRIKRYSRWLMNEHISTEMYFLPYLQVLLASLPPGPLVLVIDGSPIGRTCQALVISVLYKKRALPLAWSVVRGKKGHLSEQMHEHLVRQVAGAPGFFWATASGPICWHCSAWAGPLSAASARTPWCVSRGKSFPSPELPIEPGDTVEICLVHGARLVLCW